MSKILVVYQSFGGKTKSLAEAAAAGARSVGAETVIKEVSAVSADDLSGIGGVILATTQPFQSMAGGTKSLFERLWMGRDKIKKGIRLAIIICHMNDTKPTEDSIKAIAGHLGLEQVAGGLTVKVDEIEAGKESARQLGIAMAQGG
ncbi:MULTISPECIES: flavodoxin [Dehalococcoides]|jgi:flavodoxin|uniref:flavodoxin n=1 Tax=Dehalococcoides TaxID=61434 RepID=UPI000995D8E0|nr:flavodoxin [Dehalococcoides mccartyi]AQW62948.1 flavodoxin [Dehalococcoides mccartyi]PKH44922.1 flavodoxin [Dehalococcoides mccartyi]